MGLFNDTEEEVDRSYLEEPPFHYEQEEMWVEWFFRVMVNPITLALLIVGLIPNFIIPAYLTTQGQEFRTILTGSMLPDYQIGTTVIVDKLANPTKMNVGDVITFTTTADRETPPTTHRVIEVVQDMNGNTFEYNTQGDNNEDPDPRATNVLNIVGKVTYDMNDWDAPLFGQRPWGYWFSALRSTTARIVFFAPALVFMLFSILMSVMRMDASSRFEELENQRVMADREKIVKVPGIPVKGRLAKRKYPTGFMPPKDTRMKRPLLIKGRELRDAAMPQKKKM